MGGKSPEAVSGWLDPNRLLEFVDQLKHEAKYNIGVSQYVAVQDLLFALVAQKYKIQQPSQLRTLIGPLLCNSPEQQQDFQLRFNQWIQRIDADSLVTAQKEDEKAETFKRELRKIERKSRRFRLILLTIGACIVAVLIHLLIQAWPLLVSLISTSGPVQPIENGEGQEIQIEIVLLLGGLLLTVLAWPIWRFLMARQYFRRRTTDQKPELQQITISGFVEELLPTVVFLRIAQGLRRRIRVPSQDLDVRKTISKTIHKGGRFSPAYGYRQVLPEYLVLIDRAHHNDQQARLMTEMLQRLVRNGVFITGYYFDADPRICFPMTGEGIPYKLEDIAARYSHYRLLIFSDAEGFFSSLTGKLEPWLDRFLAWTHRAILTPKRENYWGYQELELSRKFVVLPATVDGLVNLIQSLQSGEALFASENERQAPFPKLLRGQSQRWIERDPPDSELTADMLDELRHYLGTAGYDWLSACAIFPELLWNLTVYLGNTLKTPEGKSLLQTCPITDLARLPWFRYGSIPNWLRSIFIYDMPPEREKEVRQRLEDFLAVEPNEQGIVGQQQLAIAQEHRNVTSLLARWRLRSNHQQTSQDHLMQDYIFQEFMASRKPLAVQIPHKLRQKLLRERSKHVGWPFFLQWLLATVIPVELGIAVGLAIGVNYLGAVVGLAIIAVGISVGQWLVIRKQLPGTYWGLYTVLGLFLGIGLASPVGLLLWGISNSWFWIIYFLTGGAFAGSVTALVQGIRMKRQLPKMRWWVWITVSAVGAAVGIILGLLTFVLIPSSPSFTLNRLYLLWGLIGSILYSASTGSALYWFMRQSTPAKGAQPTMNLEHPPGSRFFVQWVLANSLAMLISGLVGIVGDSWETTIIGFIVGGLCVGWAQQLVIRRFLPETRWWRATFLGSLVALGLLSVFFVAPLLQSNTSINEPAPFIMLSSYAGAVYGLGLGSAQWLTLRKLLLKSRLWILATVLGLSFGTAGGISGVLVVANVFISFPTYVAVNLWIIFGCFIYTSITGATFMRLCRNAKANGISSVRTN
ncbi:MAG: MFS transporter [Leptolyngbya sp. SIOISBB]|nr:MFS transporter [Leptolyngbya sp. SIOISBB]